jgi:hypothetical protein
VWLPARGFLISANVAPLARFIIAMTSAFLLVRSAFGLLAGFLARLAFFAGFALLPALLAPLGFAASGAGFLMFSLTIAFSLIQFLLDRVAIVTWITQLWRNIKLNLQSIGANEANDGLGIKRFGGRSFFLIGRQNQVAVQHFRDSHASAMSYRKRRPNSFEQLRPSGLVQFVSKVLVLMLLEELRPQLLRHGWRSLDLSEEIAGSPSLLDVVVQTRNANGV